MGSGAQQILIIFILLENRKMEYVWSQEYVLNVLWLGLPLWFSGKESTCYAREAGDMG